MSVDTPGWFRRAVDHRPEQRTVLVDGVDISYLAWGRIGAPGLVFIHGGAAHAHWWSFLVPLLADQYRVAAVDLSGHGDSGRRDAYPLSSWAAEVMAVADDLGSQGKPVVVGHSMGGYVAIGTGAAYADDLAGVVILDSPVSAPDPEIDAARGGQVFGTLRTYPDRASALARYRTVPEQDHYLPFVIDHVAEHSLREVDGGWTWKFDPGIFVPTRTEARDLLAQVRCRVALFRAEHGLVTPEIGAYMYETLGRVAPVVEIPEAGHHLMLDQPLLLLTALRTLLADWEHSSPRYR